MPRLSFEQMEQAVLEQMQAAGGSLTHAELVDRLEAAGLGAAAERILSLTQQGMLIPRVKAQETGAPVLSYSLAR